jgi:hypothetical protein
MSEQLAWLPGYSVKFTGEDNPTGASLNKGVKSSKT